MILNIFLKFIGILEKHRISLSVLVIILSVVLLWSMPVYLGFPFLIVLIIFILATFNPLHLRRSITRLCIFLFLIGLFMSPFLVSIGVETYKLSNPETIIDLDHPKIIEMTEEFQNLYEYDEEDYEKLLLELKNYVYEKIPYKTGHPYIYPTIQDVFSGKNSDCRARALIGFSILRNMGCDAYIVGGIVDVPHAWIRIYREDGSYVDGFESEEKKSDFTPFIIFNENSANWNNPLDQLFGMVFYGFFYTDKQELVNTITLIFFIPVSAVAIFLLLTHKNRNIVLYLLSIGISFGVPFTSGMLLYENQMLVTLPIILICGFYLRIFNFILFEKSHHFYEIKSIWKKAITKIHHI